MQNQAFIGIGSNLDNPMEKCREAATLLQAIPGITVAALSSYYKTEPLGQPDQPWYINAVAEIRSTLDPLALLHALLHIEKEMGRERTDKWGPRIIDLDLLFYGNSVLNIAALKLPHPEIPNRKFVLAPLEEIAPDHVHPVLQKTVREMLNDLPDDLKVERLAPS